MEEENVARQLSQVDNSVEEEFVTPVQVTANGLENHVSEETTLMTEETVQTSSSLSVTEIKSQTTFARQDTYTVEQVTAVEDVIPVEIDEDSQDEEIKTETDDDKVDDGNSEEPERIEENQNEIMSDEALTEEEVDEVDEASISSSGLQRQNTYTVKTVEVKESSSEVLERFTETQQLVQYKYDEEEQEEPLYKEPDEHLDTETGEMRTDETVEVRKVVEDEYVTAEEVRTQKHRTLNTVTEVNTRGEPTIMEETSLASLANLASLKTQVQEDGLDRTSRDVDQLLKDIRDPNLDCSLEDIEAMIDGKDVRELKTETNNRGSPEFAKAAALIDQNPDKGFDPDDPAVKGLEDWECSNNLTTSFDTEESKPSKLQNVFKRMSRTEERRSLLNESLNNNNFEKPHLEYDDDKFSPGCFGTTLLYIFLKIFD